MRQIFEPYWKWEDFQNGMYDTPSAAESPLLCERAASLLSNSAEFAAACRDVFSRWPVATAVNLTNIGTNRRAWLGQAACSLIHNVPELATRAAWKDLTDDQRCKANQIADEAIREYEAKSGAVHRSVGGPWLFGGNT